MRFTPDQVTMLERENMTPRTRLRLAMVRALREHKGNRERVFMAVADEIRTDAGALWELFARHQQAAIRDLIASVGTLGQPAPRPLDEYDAMASEALPGALHHERAKPGPKPAAPRVIPPPDVIVPVQREAAHPVVPKVRKWTAERIALINAEYVTCASVRLDLLPKINDLPGPRATLPQLGAYAIVVLGLHRGGSRITAAAA